jgi:hypothetical protein
MNSITVEALAGVPRKSASTTLHARLLSTRSTGALLSTGEAQAVARMEEERLVTKASLDKVSKMLRAAKKAGNIEATGGA